tara:strand:- start:38637 stop:39092 length:456 start_codon:yes stop_codon:yes gene_type:complete
MVDKKDGDGNDKNNVIPFPTKEQKELKDPKAIAIIVREVMDDLVGQLSPEQRKDFEKFLQAEKPDLADKLLNTQNYPKEEDMELVGSYSMDQITQDMSRCDALFDLTFEYIKNIERGAFKLNQALLENDLEKLRKDLQKIWYDLQEKVDFD